MKKITCLILILIVSFALAQTEKTENKIATESFIENYNNDNYKAIFSTFSSDMQDALPLEKISGFLHDLKSEAGKINNRKFIKYERGSYASYKTEFERGIFSLYISLDDELKLNGLFVKPYVDESALTKAVNNLTITDNIITKEQSEILYENTNIFPNQTQISLAIINNGEVGFYGVKRNNDSLSSLDNSKSIFEIGSISKVFTSTLLAGFVVDNKLKLNDFINDYIGFPLKNQSKITFKQLANHTSGLPRLPSNLDLNSVDQANPYKNYGAKELDEYLQNKLETKQTPGSKNEYSNLGAGLLGYVLSKYSDTSYDELLQKYLFSKYAMTSSTTIKANIKDQLVSGLDKDGKETSNWDLSVLVGAGGILSNAEDLSKFVVAQFDNSNKELELTRQKTFAVNDSMDIGLGWHILNDKSEDNWYWHNGGTGGYRSSLVFDPIKKNGIIILSNVSAFNPSSENIDTLVFALMKTLELEPSHEIIN